MGALCRALAYADACRSAKADRWPEAQNGDFGHCLNSYILACFGTTSQQLELFIQRHTATMKLTSAGPFTLLAVWMVTTSRRRTRRALVWRRLPVAIRR